ncbi:Hypothetical protein PHPALM_20028 [Phytophthora palmivora]|uniref:Uncharacterized protein n=1 Tax=Phytophthora palmivora TaxID=4796 RepID=A0A2P4XFX1_9STRA|nr:Hypothetical protein PHPALM_20028 [Phytophthora palmivora]
MRLTPPQDAKKLVDVLVSTKRVAIFLRTLNSLNGCYLGHQDDDDVTNHNITGLDDDRISDIGQCRGVVFYRKAVKWSVRRAHCVGMPTDGCLSHVIYGRMAFGLSMQEVGGLNL